VDRAHARLLAASGIECALARLRVDPLPRPGPASYPDDWTFRDPVGTRLEDALNPSYNLGDRYADAGAPAGNNRYVPGEDTVTVDREGDGRYAGWSGRLRGQTGAFSHKYVLRVEDESAKINVNGGPGWNAQLVRILDVLGEQPEVGIAGLGALVVGNRPPGGYAGVTDLQGTIETALGTTTRDLSPYLTTSSWVDPSVVHPNVREFGGERFYPFLCPAEVKWTRGPLSLEEGGRPPVNLNVAPRAVLVALLQDLRGISYARGADLWMYAAAYSIPPAMAGQIADAIVERRTTDRFDSWGEFGAFCDTLVPGKIQGMTGGTYNDGGNLCGADLLKANFDPNTHLNKQLPDQIAWRWIDKSDLATGSTEGSLDPTGAFSISSLGTVRDARADRAAESLQYQVLEMFRLVRHTTQKDFVAGRALGDSPRWLSAAGGGALTTGAAAGWGGSPGVGLAAITHPCPVPALPALAADFDGQVALATVDTEPLAPMAGTTLMFLHHFDDGWDADVGNPAGRIADPSLQDASLQTNPATSVWPADPAVRAGTLQPDGAFMQSARIPAFTAPGNLPAAETVMLGKGETAMSNRGAISLWAKVDARVCRAGPVGMFSRVRQDPASVFVGICESQSILLGRTAQEQWGMLVENSLNVNPDQGTGTERQFHTRFAPNPNTLLPDARWVLVTAQFDTKVASTSEDLYFHVQGIRGTGTDDPINEYPDPFDIVLGEDCLATSEEMSLGGGVWGGSSHVADELAICDLGTDPTQARTNAQNWHMARYAAGRYYKGNDGAFLSPVIEPAPGAQARLAYARWTAYLPGEARREIAVAGSSGGPPAEGQPRILDATLLESRVDVDLMDEAGTTIVRPLAQGTDRGAVPSRFRYRVTFRPTESAAWNAPNYRQHNPVLETPVFDDITLAYVPPGATRVLSWEERQ
ncbi:MAG: hypothetical protein HY608_07070, partial [Planctomycetes bacterium]|nr:hypothetical protein [Planctomycetota bacterium]